MVCTSLRRHNKNTSRDARRDVRLFDTMTDMYEDPKAMEADGNLKPFGHEERGSEASNFMDGYSRLFLYVEFSTCCTWLTRWTRSFFVAVP